MGRRSFGSIFIPATLLAIVLTAFVLDRLIFPLLEDHKLYWGSAWSADEKTLFKLSCLRNWASSQEPLFRNHVIMPLKKPQGPRILVMGDSYVWGDGTRNINDLWWRQLERELIKRGYGNIEVLAAGYPGYSTNLEVKAARKLASTLKPDLIIWGFTDNDADEEVIINYNKSKESSIWLLKRFLPNLSLFLDRQVLSKWHGFSSLDTTQKGGECWQLSLLSGKNFELFTNTVKDMGAFLQQAKVPGVVFTLPKTLDADYSARCFGTVRPLFEQNKIPYVDLTDALMPWYAKTLPTVLQQSPIAVIKPTSFLLASPANSHPSAALNYYYAVQAANYLEQHHSDLLGKPTAYQGGRAILNDAIPIFASFVMTAQGFDLDYPDPSLLLRMPGRAPYVQFNFAMPAKINKITVTGPALKKGQLGISTITPTIGFDTGDFKYSAWQNGNTITMDLSDTRALVNSIYLTASFTSNKKEDRHLSVRLDQ